MVWDRQAGIHGHGGRPTEEFAAFCGQLKVDWHFCEPADPQAKGVVERLQDFIERSFEPGRAFANELDFQLQLDTWFAERANVRHHKTLRCRPVDRLLEERELMAPLPAAAPDTDRRWVLRVPPDPHLRFDTCDYSLDPAPGRPARRGPRHATARSSRSRWTPASSPAATSAVFAKHRTITDLAHARALRAGRARAEPAVEIRPLARYDALIA